MNLTEITLYENKSHRILQEGWQELTEEQQKYQLRWENELWPLVESYKTLMEAELTPDQIQKIFTSAEQVTKATGNNQTALGKAGTKTKEIAQQVRAKIKELEKAAKNSKPVQNADIKFEKLKKDILSKNKDSKIVKGIERVSQWAKENPGKASIAVGILTTVAAFAGGPGGGLAAGMVLRASKGLLQGEELSTAVGKAAKTGALGALIGLGIQGIGDAIEGTANVVKDTVNPNYMRADWDYLEDNVGLPDDWANARLVGYPEDIKPVRAAWDNAVEALKNNDYNTFQSEWSTVEDAVDKFNSEEYQASLQGTKEARQEWADGIAAFSKMADGVAAAAQGAVQASDKKESIELWDEFEEYQLREAPNFMAAMGQAANKAGQTVAKGASAVANKAKGAAQSAGNELGNKVTAKKLMKQWKAAGSPTNTGSIIKILRQAGLSDTLVSAVSKQSKVKLASEVDPTVEKLANKIKNLDLGPQVKELLKKADPQGEFKSTRGQQPTFKSKRNNPEFKSVRS